jgi:hypothetical protein
MQTCFSAGNQAASFKKPLFLMALTDLVFQSHLFRKPALELLILGLIDDRRFASAGRARQIEIPPTGNLIQAGFIVELAVTCIANERPAVSHVFAIRLVGHRIWTRLDRIKIAP